MGPLTGPYLEIMSAPHGTERSRPRPVAFLDLPRGHGTAIGVVAVALASASLVSLRQSPWLAVVTVALAPVLAAVAVIDLRTHRIPNALTLTAAAVAVLVLGAASVATADGGALLRAVGATAVIGFLYWLLARFTGLGFGDVKLTAVLAFGAGWADWRTVVAFVLLSHLLAAPVAIWFEVRRRRRAVPMGPAFVVGLYLALALTR